MAVLAQKVANRICAEDIAGFTQTLLKWKGAELKVQCVKSGLPSSGTKAELVSKLTGELEGIRDPKELIPSRLVSLDLGYRNFARAILDYDSSNGKVKLLDWRRDEIPLPETFHPRAYAELVYEFANQILSDSLINNETMFLIERQTHRGSGFRMIPGIILNINRIEIQLHCFLLNRKVACIDPRLVQAHYNWSSGKTKKKDSIALAEKYCEGTFESETRLQIPQGLQSIFLAESKKDDLADCLLQGLAYFDWRRNLAFLYADLLTRSGPFQNK